MDDMELFKTFLDDAGAEYNVGQDGVVVIKYAPSGTADRIRDLPYQVDILDYKNIDHSTLVVRVAGFSAYFVDMHKEVQDQIIARTKQKLGKERK